MNYLQLARLPNLVWQSCWLSERGILKTLLTTPFLNYVLANGRHKGPWILRGFQVPWTVFFQNTASSLPPKTQSCKTCCRNINTHSHLMGLFPPASYKLALTKSIANEWTTKAFAICLYGDWTPYCCPSTPPEGVQGGVRHSVLQGIWWDRSLDSWMLSRTGFSDLKPCISSLHT